jgi:CubicO group peptidase (beta-lactamase class C family)
MHRQDPVSKYLPSFLPNDTSLVSGRSSHPHITLHDLSSHLSGLGRDWPPGQQASNFPEDLGGNGPPPENGLPFPSDETVLGSIRKHTLVHPPGYRPSYSNTGPGVLGMALVAADKLARGGKPGPETVAELMTRDIFESFGLTGSTYKPNSSQLDRVVVPEIEPDLVDLDFGNAMNPSGGQFSTLNDLAVVLRSLLDPPRNLKNIPASSALTPESVAHWLRPVHAYEEDDWSESGAPWEIVKHLDAWGRRRRIYFKRKCNQLRESEA